MKNCCLENKCIKCCLETSMLLSNQDINKIKKLGYDKNFFVRKKNGWLQLKNINGKCVFHNGKICTIYENRPEGCSLYPIIYDMDAKSAVFDKDCPLKHEFIMTKQLEKKLYALVSKIEKEREKR